MDRLQVSVCHNTTNIGLVNSLDSALLLYIQVRKEEKSYFDSLPLQTYIPQPYNKCQGMSARIKLHKEPE